MSRGFIDVELSIPNRDSDNIGERWNRFARRGQTCFKGYVSECLVSSFLESTYFHTAEKSSLSVVNRNGDRSATIGQRSLYRSRERGEIGLQSSFLERLPVKICRDDRGERRHKGET